MSMKKNTGYTLIELMTMLAVAAILLTIGVPQLKVYFQSNRMVSNTNDLVTALDLARSEAIRRGVHVTVCESSAATTVPACDGAKWNNGWIVFVEDATGAQRGTIGKYETASGDVLVRAHPSVNVNGNNVTITPKNGNIGSYVSFTSQGVPKDALGDSLAGSFVISDTRGLKAEHCVKLNAAGSVRSDSNTATVTTNCP